MDDKASDVSKIEVSQVPLHVAVLQRLLANIRDGTWKPGTRLPSEAALADAMHVSRVTLRDALSLLEQDGLLERTHGVGTFVRSAPPVLEIDLQTNPGITELIRRSGLEPGAADAELSRVQADSTIAEKLAVPPNTGVYCLKRVRTASGVRILYSAAFFRTDLFPDPRPLFDLHSSLYELLEEQTGMGSLPAVATLTPLRADSLLSEKLGIPLQCPLLLLEQTDFSPSNEPILFSCDYYVRHVVRFVVHRGAA